MTGANREDTMAKTRRLPKGHVHPYVPWEGTPLRKAIEKGIKFAWLRKRARCRNDRLPRIQTFANRAIALKKPTRRVDDERYGDVKPSQEGRRARYRPPGKTTPSPLPVFLILDLSGRRTLFIAAYRNRHGVRVRLAAPDNRASPNHAEAACGAVSPDD